MLEVAKINCYLTNFMNFRCKYYEYLAKNISQLLPRKECITSTHNVLTEHAIFRTD